MWLTYVFCFVLCADISEINADNVVDTTEKSGNNSVKVVPLSAVHQKSRMLPRPRFKRPVVMLKERKEHDCWMTLNAKGHFKKIEALEQKYAKVRQEYNEDQLIDKFDEEMLFKLLENQGATNREAQKAGNKRSLIPSGINLGGYSMMRMPDSVLFFHRMKLRNDTRFRVNFLSSNFSSMTMVARLSLNDLHLVGNYERAQTKDNPGLLQYSPTYGQIEVLLRDVIYKIDGRYRLQKDRLYLEMILSELYIPYDGIIMLYTNSTNNAERQVLQTKNIADFLDRLKSDLDLWIKDFFNEFLLDYPLKKDKIKNQFLQYDKERIITLNRYVDDAIDFLKGRLKELKADMVKLPSFVIYAFNGLVLHLKDGSLSGLDTMYRRAMATNTVEKLVRKVDALIAFSSLKARYSYEVKLTTGAPPLYGSVILTGDELSAIMSLSMVKEPVFVDLHFDFMQQLKPESLTVEGSVGRMISSFKHFLELHIIAIMKNTMIDQVKQLSTLTKCVPSFVSYTAESDKSNGKDTLSQQDENASGDPSGPEDPSGGPSAPEDPSGPSDPENPKGGPSESEDPAQPGDPADTSDEPDAPEDEEAKKKKRLRRRH